MLNEKSDHAYNHLGVFISFKTCYSSKCSKFGTLGCLLWPAGPGELFTPPVLSTGEAIPGVLCPILGP